MRRVYLLLLIFAALSAPTAFAATPPAGPRHPIRFEHQVHITPTRLAPGETAIDIGPSEWTLQGYDLRGLLARAFDLEPARVQLALPELSDQDGNARYDVSVTLAGDESDAALQGILRKAVEERFHLTTVLETRSMEVLVLTAPAGPGRGLRTAVNKRVSAAQTSVITVEGRVCPGISSAGITAQYATVDRLAAALEENLDRVVLDETHLASAFAFHVPEYRDREELFSLLRQELGLTVQFERRDIKVLTAHAPDQAISPRVAGI